MSKIFLGLVGPQVTLFGQPARPQPPMGLAYIMNAVRAADFSSGVRVSVIVSSAP